MRKKAAPKRRRTNPSPTQEDEAGILVPLLDLTKQYESLRPEIEEAIASLLAGGQFILGPEVEAFEEEMARYCRTRFAIGVSSGTDALLVALMALGVSAGDEVVTTPFTFFATGGAIARLGARPVFADIEPRSFNIDPSQVEKAVTGRTKALLPVHLFGRCASMAPLVEIARGRGLALIEDAAQAIGARTKLGAAGAVGDAGCLSFFPTKNLGAFGDAGMVLTGREDLARRIRRLRVHGAPDKYLHEEVGGNFRLDALQAAVLRVKLRHLDAWSDRRLANARRYNALFREAGLEGEGETPVIPQERHIFHQNVIRARRRDALRAHLAERGVQTGVYYPLPLHLQPCFRHLGHREGDFPESERASREVLALPMYPELAPKAQERVVEGIRGFYR